MPAARNPSPPQVHLKDQLSPRDVKVEPTAVNRETIAAIYPLIQPHVRRTPVMEIDAADFGLSGGPLVLKLELFQHTGSFKPRGALASLLSRPVPVAGVVAASGGNHGLAVAFAARKLGVPARIFVPSVSAATKRERIREFGAELVIAVLYPSRYAQAGAVLQALMLRASLLALASPAEDLLIAAGEWRVTLVGNVFRAIWTICGSLAGYYLFGFMGFTYGAALNGLPPLVYFLWVQNRKGLLHVRFELYKFLFVIGVAVLAYAARVIVFAIWPTIAHRSLP